MAKTWAFRPPDWLEKELQQYATEHKTSQTDTILGYIETLRKKTGASVQGARPEVPLLSPISPICEQRETSDLSHHDSPTEAPEPATASLYPIHPSRLPFGTSHNTGKTDSTTSQQDFSTELANTNNGKIDTSQLSQPTKEKLILIQAETAKLKTRIQGQLIVEQQRQETKRIYRGVYHPSRIVDVEEEPKMPDFNDLSRDIPMPKTEEQRQRLLKQMEQSDKEKVAEINKKIRQIVS